jgi:serine/threonine protein kinase/formylglycine-generating enzyme required for sulfatase activity
MTASTDPLTRAIELSIEFETTEGEKDIESFLAEHESLRDILEPLLRQESTPDERPVLGDFELVRELGRGGMGVVYEAIQTLLGRTVALKLLPPHRALSPRSLAMFRREATLAASLDHPGIAKVLEFQEIDGQLALAMELIDGIPLDDILAPLDAAQLGSLTAVDLARAAGVAVEGDAAPEGWRGSYEMTAVELARQLAEALAHANSRGIVHRDVKPGNILITPMGKAVLTDFGLAKEEGMLGMTRSGEFAGTYQYAAPEQLEGRIDELDGRTDVYALGATLYELLTLKRPLEADSLTELVQLIQREEPAPPSKINPRVRPDLEAVVLCALEKDRKKRYATAEEFAIDLAHVLDGSPVKARRISLPARATRWVKRNQLVTAMIVVLVVATGMVSFFQMSASASLARFDNLWVGAALDSLEAQAAQTHPLWPERSDELRELVNAAETVLGMRQQHEVALAALRVGYVVDGEADRFGRTAHLAMARIAEIRGLIRRLTEQSKPKGVPLKARKAAEAEISALRLEMTELQTELSRSNRVQIPDVAVAALHDRLENQLYRLEHLEKGVLADLRFRLAWSESVRKKSIVDLTPKWADAAKRVASDGRFSGMSLTPQIGLVPLGPDPTSGLEEFAHMLSGEVPHRDGDGKLLVGVEHGMVFILMPGGTHALLQWQNDPRLAHKKDWKIKLVPFFLAKHELSRAQWRRIARGIPGLRWRDGGVAEVRNEVELHKPVNGVTWDMCDALFRTCGLDFPTHAQWAYAALFDGGIEQSDLPKIANLRDLAYTKGRGYPPRAGLPWNDGHVALANVASMAPTPAGFHHLHGNVSEWCRDVHNREVRPRDGDGLRDSWAGKFVIRINTGGHWLDTHPLNFLNRRIAASAVRSVGVRAARRIITEEPR